eukprot:2712659-Prymnesium_polylepis.1
MARRRAMLERHPFIPPLIPSPPVPRRLLSSPVPRRLLGLLTASKRALALLFRTSLALLFRDELREGI